MEHTIDPMHRPYPETEEAPGTRLTRRVAQEAAPATTAIPPDETRYREGEKTMAEGGLVQLTLAAPRYLEEELVEQLLAHPDWAEGFTLVRAEGHSHRAQTLSPHERVRGRADRVSLNIVLEAGQAQALLNHLKHHLAKPDVAYWLTPVFGFGRLA